MGEVHTTHARTSALSRQAHALAPRAYAGEAEAKAALAGVEDEVDRAAAALRGLTDAEPADVRASLPDLKGVGQQRAAGTGADRATITMDWSQP